MKKQHFLGLVITVCLGLMSCGKDSGVPPETNKPNLPTEIRGEQSLEGTEWVLKNLTKKPLPQYLENVVSLSFSKRVDTTSTSTSNGYMAHGKSFINMYGGNVKMNEGKNDLSFTNGIFSTKMAGETELMDAEIRYLEALGKANYYIIKDNELWIYANKNERNEDEILHFVKQNGPQVVICF